MYENAEPQIDSILRLVAKCPEPLQLRCFEILLEGYVASLAPAGQSSAIGTVGDAPPLPTPHIDNGVLIPAEIDNRFKATAKRLNLQIEHFAALFDFNSDPFTYHALHVPGESKAERTRNVALLDAAKTYLGNGQWSADWKEVRAHCVDQNCYDRKNMGSYMKHGYFKSASDEAGIVLSPAGIRAAEVLLTQLAGTQG